MIEDIETGRQIATDILPVDPGDIMTLGPGWNFDWSIEIADHEVYKLIDPANPGGTLGLIAIDRCDKHIEIILLESSPPNVGRSKRFGGIAGSLIAFAAQISFKIGGEGFLALDAKTELIEHYRRAYGFERVGRRRMILATDASILLVRKYVRRDFDG